MSWVFCSTGQALWKAGAGESLTSNTSSGAILAAWSDEVEDIINGFARVDLITDYDNLTTNGKKILQALSSDMVAQRIVGFDTSGYLGAREAETLLDLLEANIVRNKNLIENDRIKGFLGAT